ncbi:MAG: thiosulfate oxidation carrier complex protein SoxZ [Hyphomicrobiales bacterium]|nr:thiosulfate oxidation carrier complex protein SoxZ [Hyphomicrobiales bacterium]
MARKPKPRVRVPAKAAKGDIIEIKTLISHPMESGQRRGKDGKKVPRQIINKFTAAFNGKMFFEADWLPAVSANPYQSFYFRAQETGEFTFSWKDDNGETYTAKKKMAVG